MRSKFKLLFVVCALFVAIPAVAALADTLTVSNAVNVNQNATKAPGDTGTANVWLEPTNGTPAGDQNGCNASTAAGQAVTVTLSSNNPAVTFPNGNTAQITDCGSANAKQVSYKVANNASAGTAVISATASGGKSGQTNLYNTNDTLTITITAPADTTAPTLHLPANITEEATGASGKVVNFTATADDANPAHPAVTCTPASGSTFAIGTTTVNCEATDAAGNKATGSFTVTVQDTTAPNISGTPSDITKEATGANGATASWTAPTATDAVDGNVSVNCESASGLKSGDTFPLGSTTVTCTATDNAGNKATSSFSVKVQDTTGPVLSLPADITKEATSAAGAVVTFTASANDAVTGPRPVTCSPASGATFPLGPTTVNCSANDGSGNSSTGSFKVTVQDTTAPVIATHLDVTATATSNAGATVTYSSPATSDAVDGAKTATCTPASGTQFAVGSTTVTCNATDAAGNHATPTTFKVNVSYGWSGFLQPINTPTNMAPSPYTQSVFKIGSTVPVKFKLTGASAGITDGNFYLKYIRTGNGDGLGETEVVAAATGNTGTQFRYDATAGQYIFNWSTKGLSPAGNYEVRVYTDPNFTNLLGSQSIELKR
jgi:hypothetical protein